MDEYVVNEKRRQIQIVAAVILSVFMFSVDFSMMNISLPSISKYFHVHLGKTAMLPTLYILIVTSTILGFGKLGDLKGYRNVFVLGICVFILGSILCSLAPSINALIALRMFQSLGEAMFSPVGVAILTTFLPYKSRGQALGLVAMTQGLGFALGNVLGGFINAHFIWRGIFLLNIPIALLTIALTLKVVPTKQEAPAERRFDITGAVMIFIALASLLHGLGELGKLTYSLPVILISFSISIIGFIAFIIQEKRIHYPILHLELFKNLNFTYANISALMLVSILMGFTFITPFYMELVKGLPVMKAGLFLTIAPIMMLITAPISGKISDRIGSRLLCSVGTALEILALGILASLKQDSSLSLIALGLFVLGTAVGIFMAPNNKLVMAHAPRDKQGVASGVYKICLSGGGVLGIALFPMVLVQTVIAKAAALNIPLAQTKHMPEMMQAGFHNAFIFGMIVAGVALIFSLLAKDSAHT